MPELHLGISFHLSIILLAAVVAFLVSFALYRTTVPVVSVRLRVLLGVFRWIALFLLFMFIGEPLLSLISRTTEQPAILTLVDNSKSLTIRDGAGDRKQILRSVLSSSTFDGLSSLGSLQYGIFDAQARFMRTLFPDSLLHDGETTDIARALAQSREHITAHNVQALILLTDGNSTTGTNPTYEAIELGIPVFSIGIGDTSEQKDVLIRRVFTNAMTYVGNRVPVNVTVKSVGYGGERVEVTLSDEQQIVDRRFLTLERGSRDYPVSLSFVPETEGSIRLTVTVSSLPGELTTQNNRFVVFTKALKSKMRVLLVAGAPSADVGAIRRALEKDPNIEVTARIQRRDGSFYEGPLTAQTLQNTECIFLLGFPTAATSSQFLQELVTAGREKGVFVLLSRTVDVARLRMLESLLPVAIASGTNEELQAFMNIDQLQGAHPLMKTSTTPPDGWSKLPPIFKLQTQFVPRPESQVLGTTRIQTTLVNDPFLVSRSVARHKSVMLLGYGVWRWKILVDEQYSELLDEFLGNTVRWLTARDDENRTRVRTTKEFFSGQEAVEFTAQVYDESLQPVNNAQVNTTIRGGGRVFEVKLEHLGNGQYAAELDGLQEGDYRFAATVHTEGKLVHEDRGSFSVGSLNAEFLETRMNKELLEHLAVRTGGKYYDATSHQSLPADIAALANFQPREVVRSEELQLWNSSWMLAIIVSLFAIEWMLRKRNGLL